MPTSFNVLNQVIAEIWGAYVCRFSKKRQLLQLEPNATPSTWRILEETIRRLRKVPLSLSSTSLLQYARGGIVMSRNIKTWSSQLLKRDRGHTAKVYSLIASPPMTVMWEHHLWIVSRSKHDWLEIALLPSIWRFENLITFFGGWRL